MKKEMLCVLGARPQTPGIYRIVAKGKWHLIRQWNANLFPLAYRLSPVACLRSARAADNSEDPRKIDSTWHIPPASGKRELGLLANPGYGCRWGENERGDSNGKTTQMSASAILFFR